MKCLQTLLRFCFWLPSFIMCFHTTCFPIIFSFRKSRWNKKPKTDSRMGISSEWEWHPHPKDVSNYWKHSGNTDQLFLPCLYLCLMYMLWSLNDVFQCPSVDRLFGHPVTRFAQNKISDKTPFDISTRSILCIFEDIHISFSLSGVALMKTNCSVSFFNMTNIEYELHTLQFY